MKSSHFRKGNIVGNKALDTFKKGYVEMEARWIYEMAVKESAQEYNQYVDFFEPIPLTEEWLKKLGFTWAEGLRMNVIKDGITVCEPDDYEDSVYHSIYFYHNGECFGFEVSNEWGENGSVMLPKVKYVHQLQNLYFALTGEELTIKE